MNKKCKNCGADFELTDADLKFLEKVSPKYATEIRGEWGGLDSDVNSSDPSRKKFFIPPPTFCPDCRQQRRISWRNERSLYYRTCFKTGQKIIAMYSDDSVFPVYDNEVWWGDVWDGKEYGRDFDFSRPFFEQIAGLRDQVPHFALAVATTTCENSDYVNHAGYLKNCYLIFNTDYAERCMYGKGVNRCFDCLDCFKIYDCEACYECMNSYNCKFCTYVWDSHNSSECHFSYNLIGCKNCFLCVNLQNQEYCFFNEKFSKGDFEKKVEEYRTQHENSMIFEEFLKFKTGFPVKRLNENNTENCTGDYLVNCKNCRDCYDCEYMENCRYCYDLKKGDSVTFENYDLSAFGVGVLNCYEGGTVGYNDNHCLFCENVWESFDVHYSMLCVNNCKHCFGCIGLKKDEYCIFNKQYSCEDYEVMVAKIIEHMVETGEWGEFFPTEISPFGYNETMAQEYFPMTREEVLAKGWKWKNKDESEYKPQSCGIPANIKDVDESICDEILACKKTGKNFKIQKAELDFYKKWGIQIPKYCPDVRHLKRLSYRNPRKLGGRVCGKCGVMMETTYGSDRRCVCCEKCYLREVY